MRLSTQPATACVYAIKHTKDLLEAKRKGGDRWTESATWRRAWDLLKDSDKEGTWLPILFAAADVASDLLYVAHLDEVRPDQVDLNGKKCTE